MLRSVDTTIFMTQGIRAEDVSVEVLSSLRRIIRAIDLHSKRLMQKHGLTGPQLYVLKELGGGRQEISVGTIALKVSISSATVTDIVARLEKRGLVQRVRSTADKRKVLVRATAEGENLLASAPPLLQEQFIAKFRQLEAWEETFILSALQRLVAMMEAEDVAAPPPAAAELITELSESAAQFLDSAVPGVGEPVLRPQKKKTTARMQTTTPSDDE